MSPSDSSASQLRRVGAFARPHRRLLVTVLCLVATIGAINATEPLVLKSVFDALNGRLRLLGVSVGLLLLLALIRELGFAVATWMTWRVRLRAHHALLEATMSRLHLLPPSIHREQGVGTVTARLDRSI